jgi:CRP/FNR family cyclic AMP-dependent transcriptional regulator
VRAITLVDMADPLFRPGDPVITPGELQELAAVGDETTRKPGTTFMAQDEKSTFVLLIRKGYVKVSTATVVGRTVHVKAYLREAGETVGERGVLTGQPRGATVEALTETTVLGIAAEKWIKFLDDHQRAERAQSWQAEMRGSESDEMALLSDFGRERAVARALGTLSKPFGGEPGVETVDIFLGQDDLAQFAHLTLDQTKKALVPFKDAGLLEVSGKKHMTITNLSRIQGIAASQAFL